MITKEEAIIYIKNLAESKILSKEELEVAFDSAFLEKIDISTKKKFGITEILYYIGGAIVFVGISIMVWQNWKSFGFITKVSLTLGSSIVAYYLGVILSQKQKNQGLGLAFHLISALLMPIGIYVVFNNAGFDMGSLKIQSLTSAILFCVYICSYVIFKNNIFLLFSILFGTWFYFALTGQMSKDIVLRKDFWNFNWYRILIAGISYMLMGQSFSKNEKSSLSGFLFGFGVFSFLLSGLMLGGWKPEEVGKIIWELIYIGIVFVVLFISIKIKRKSFLIWGTVFLMIYILKITSEYFSVGLGWPFALIIAGLAMMGVGYLSVSINKRYLKK